MIRLKENERVIIRSLVNAPEKPLFPDTAASRLWHTPGQILDKKLFNSGNTNLRRKYLEPLRDRGILESREREQDNQGRKSGKLLWRLKPKWQIMKIVTFVIHNDAWSLSLSEAQILADNNSNDSIADFWKAGLKSKYIQGRPYKEDVWTDSVLTKMLHGGFMTDFFQALPEIEKRKLFRNHSNTMIAMHLKFQEDSESKPSLSDDDKALVKHSKRIIKMYENTQKLRDRTGGSNRITGNNT